MKSVLAILTTVVALVGASPSYGLPIVGDVPAQPLAAQTARVVQALDHLGAPLTAEQRQAYERAVAIDDEPARVARIQEVLDPLCLVGVNVNAESRVKVERGPANAKLVQHGWRVFLVKVHNEAGVTAPLRVSSPNALPMLRRSTGSPSPVAILSKTEVADRWLDVQSYDEQPLNKPLSGLEVEYRIVQLYSRDAEKREAKLTFDVGQGTQDLGFRNEISILFDILPAIPVVLEIIDFDGRPTGGHLLIRDDEGRVYPARSRRLSPDFFFQDQVYRHSGQAVLLPPGNYTVAVGRGPEYVTVERKITVPERDQSFETFRLKRWINMAQLGWYSGDHHVHAAGCSHYESPTEGVTPADMMRHIIGEDLNVGCVLSWGPCWYHQKQFFEGNVSQLSTPHNLMRYDVEVSGFPSSHAGHLCLLRLKEDDYPGTSKIDEWPSWDLPVLQWGKQQGAVVGFSHSGWGLQTKATTVPNDEMPKFDGIGANEYIVDVVHGACDFISAVDTPIPWELNIWYHTLNCGYMARISGETDFPCIYGERVGLGRSYVKLGTDRELSYDGWVHGLRDGRSYVTDGLSHLFDMTVGGLGVGEPGANGRASVLTISPDKPLKVNLKAAALLGETPREELRTKPLDQKPYWHLERARIGATRTVPVELVVNGEVVETKAIAADGSTTDVAFEYTPKQSCWIAVRIFASSHTNPVFVEVDGHPIRARKRSAQWCLDAVDVCWKSKQAKIRDSERAAAADAYEVARQAYRKIIAECAE
ncbi:MAG TPA: CehA/McbA family metallohydrolase [Pirellulales bacterium]|nr:CehA/McbA family metallohydrolase [Pirellulales bacterium]